MNDTTIATTDKLAITKDRVKGWGACASGYKWFLEKFPQGAQFSDVYASLQADKRYDDSGWLIDKVFAELDTAGRVQQIVLVSGANKQKIEKSVAEGANAATTGNWSNAATTGEGLLRIPWNCQQGQGIRRRCHRGLPPIERWQVDCRAGRDGRPGWREARCLVFAGCKRRIC